MKNKEYWINKIHQGDALEILKQMPSDFVDCIITSPPYWSCRSYLPENDKNKKFEIGLEDHPQQYIDKIVEISLECIRVLKKTGVFFLNLGDVFYTPSHKGSWLEDKWNKGWKSSVEHRINIRGKHKDTWLQHKGRLLLPMRIAIELQNKGIIIRDVIIWVKKLTKYPERTSIGSTIPFPVKDRLVPSFEYIFQIVKSKKYYFDLEPIKNEMKETSLKRFSYPISENYTEDNPFKESLAGLGNFRKNILTWNVKLKNTPLKANPTNAVMFKQNNRSTNDNHYAKFPESMVEFFILAGCPAQVCKKCGKPRERIIKAIGVPRDRNKYRGEIGRPSGINSLSGKILAEWKTNHPDEFLGWTDCGCNAGFEPGIVLDPFMGSGTTAIVSKKLGRNYIGIELNEEYIKMAKEKLDKIYSLPGI
jgi:DNA modification methylase